MADLHEDSLAPGEVGQLDEPRPATGDKHEPRHTPEPPPTPEPDTDAYATGTDAHEPGANAHEPGAADHEPGTGAHEPGTGAHEPGAGAQPGAAPTPRATAQSLLTHHPITDGHNGLPQTLHHLTWYDLELGESTLRTDIPRLRTGGVGAMFWSLALPAGTRPERAVPATLDLVDLTTRVIESNPDALRLTRTPSDTADARSHGRIACLLGPAEAASLGDSLGALRALHALGVRSLSLYGTSWAGPHGLTRFGEEVVRECNRLGILLDLSDSSPRTAEHTLTVAKAPVVFSRSGAAALTPHPANVTDATLATLRTHKGLCMVPCAGARTGPALTDVADHLDHVREVAGPECVALSGTYDTAEQPARGVEDTSRYPDLIAELLHRGWPEPDLALLTWGNAQRVLRETDFTARAAQQRRPPSTATITQLDG